MFGDSSRSSQGEVRLHRGENQACGPASGAGRRRWIQFVRVCDERSTCLQVLSRGVDEEVFLSRHREEAGAPGELAGELRAVRTSFEEREPAACAYRSSFVGGEFPKCTEQDRMAFYERA